MEIRPFVRVICSHVEYVPKRFVTLLTLDPLRIFNVCVKSEFLAFTHPYVGTSMYPYITHRNVFLGRSEKKMFRLLLTHPCPPTSETRSGIVMCGACVVCECACV